MGEFQNNHNEDNSRDDIENLQYREFLRRFRFIKEKESEEPVGPVAESVEKIEQERFAFTAQLSKIFNGNGGRNKQEAFQRLFEKSNDIESSLRNSLETIAKSTHANEAVKIMKTVLSTHDRRIIGSIGAVSGAPKDEWLPEASNELIHDCAMAFVDPDDISLPFGVESMPMEKDDAIRSLHEKVKEKLVDLVEISPDQTIDDGMYNKKKTGQAIMLGGATIASAIAWNYLSRRRNGM